LPVKVVVFVNGNKIKTFRNEAQNQRKVTGLRRPNRNSCQSSLLFSNQQKPVMPLYCRGVSAGFFAENETNNQYTLDPGFVNGTREIFNTEVEKYRAIMSYYQFFKPVKALCFHKKQRAENRVLFNGNWT